LLGDCREFRCDDIGFAYHEHKVPVPFFVESWNSSVDFICYGGKAGIQTNDPDV
jgi:hypothetical protein